MVNTDPSGLSEDDWRQTSIHSLLDPIAQNMRTTAALSTKEGVNALASGGCDLTRAQRATAGVTI